MGRLPRDTVRVMTTMHRRQRDKIQAIVDASNEYDFISDFVRIAIYEKMVKDGMGVHLSDRPVVTVRKNITRNEIITYMKQKAERTNDGKCSSVEISDYYGVKQGRVHGIMDGMTKGPQKKLMHAGYKWEMREGTSRRGNKFKRKIRVAYYLLIV